MPKVPGRSCIVIRADSRPDEAHVQVLHLSSGQNQRLSSINMYPDPHDTTRHNYNVLHAAGQPHGLSYWQQPRSSPTLQGSQSMRQSLVVVPQRSGGTMSQNGIRTSQRHSTLSMLHDAVRVPLQTLRHTTRRHVCDLRIR